MLPGVDGLEVCKQTQRDRNVPVLMLTARDSEADLLVGLGVGADDYMTKPFSMQELVARLRALLRRAGAAPDAPDQGLVNVGDLTVDPDTREARVNGTEVDLAAREFDLLRHLARRPGVVHNREQLRSGLRGRRGRAHRGLPHPAACGGSSAPTLSAPFAAPATPWRPGR
jgi:DNA-binding response OmpR family regulator